MKTDWVSERERGEREVEDVRGYDTGKKSTNASKVKIHTTIDQLMIPKTINIT